MRISFAVFLFCFLSFAALSQDKKAITDSLEAELKKEKHDSLKVLDMCELCAKYTFTDQDKALSFSGRGIALAGKISFPRGSAICLYESGIVYYYQGKYDRALECYLASLGFFEKYVQSHPHDTASVKYVGDNLHNMGKVYNRQRQYDNALQSYSRALEIFRSINSLQGISSCYNNMAAVYDAKKDHEKTRYYLEEFLKIAEQLGDKHRISTGYNNIGLVYKNEKKYSEALVYLNKGLKMREEINDIKGLAYSYNDLGDLYMELGDVDKSIELYNRSLEYAERSNSKERVQAAYSALATAYSKTKQYEKAYKYQALLGTLKDSIFTEETVKRTAEMTARYEADKKQHQIEMLQKSNEVQAAEIAKSDAERKSQQLQKVALASGLVLILIIVVLVLVSYRQKQRDHRDLALQKSIIEEKHKEITDSIVYAKRIQQAMLTSENYISKYAPEHFIYFKPRDIVSGDFYWGLYQHGKFWMAACDCTGHGVPGAFMSLLNISYLNEAVLEKKISSPERVLEEVRASIMRSLDSDGKHENRDGMDCAVFAIDFDNMILEAACANNSLYVYRNDAFIELKADKQPVGLHQEVILPYTLHRMPLVKGDMIYAFTDGFADQFGGKDGKKFKSTNFRKLLEAVHDRPMQEQMRTISDTFEKWRGNLEQVDDVCVIGVRV